MHFGDLVAVAVVGAGEGARLRRRAAAGQRDGFGVEEGCVNVDRPGFAQQPGFLRLLQPHAAAQMRQCAGIDQRQRVRQVHAGGGQQRFPVDALREAEQQGVENSHPVVEEVKMNISFF